MGRVAMVPLSQDDMILAARESEVRTRKLLKDAMPKADEASMGYQDVFNNIAACEILFRACKDVGDPTLKRGAFKTPHEISAAFSNDELGVLHHQYLTVKAEIGPIIATMTEDEIEAWIRVLAEGGSAIPLDLLSHGALTRLVLSMASRLFALQTANSSAGSPAEVDTTTSEVSPE